MLFGENLSVSSIYQTALATQPQIKASQYNLNAAQKGLDIAPARVKFIKVYPCIGKTIAATCTLANNLVNFFGECDFTPLAQQRIFLAQSDWLVVTAIRKNASAVGFGIC